MKTFKQLLGDKQVSAFGLHHKKDNAEMFIRISSDVEYDTLPDEAKELLEDVTTSFDDMIWMRAKAWDDTPYGLAFLTGKIGDDTYNIRITRF